MAKDPSALGWWNETPRIDLRAIMDELDPGWATWDDAPALTNAE